ncbi:LysR family transcriptional regulator [Profundibacter amoris]|uniref:LysR family transcriptional regulator n=1 Tax=Profundibacter amoris TaxID=2171755 RepID=A0A347UCD8_9RHOB|nr:LysR family transcriptional regulator [Profundibacter amoris]AXX96516.1 LysR family transcriptional regulator [Profundibacter amoris]
MDKSLANLDWSLMQSFLAVAEGGSLSAAARRLGASQPTLGRQIRQAEQQLGVTLFTRKSRGLQLTDIGQALLPAAQTMREAAGQMALAAAGQEQQIKGTVRITASVFVSHHILPPIIAHIVRQEPDIAIELTPNDASENLLFREADIAIRMYRPTQLDVVAKHLGDLPLGVFGSVDYLNRKGRPETIEEMLNDHDLIGYDADEQILRGMRQMGQDAQRDWFHVRCDNNVVYWELLRAGCGLGFSQIYVAMDDPQVEQVLPDLPIPPLPVWLVAHQAMRQTPRIRHVWDMLANGLSPFVS